MWLEHVETEVWIGFVIIFVKLPLKDKASVRKDAVSPFAKQKSLSVLFYFF
jgi:hypothetical protein